ncbi:hypothetical protein RA210_U200006 [Rubrivivax sp. A210]|uniref:hypothetical protein n=1 Tax=Rubrivivax sp. A210 TaxID=2772301 RepID=UPI001919A5AF|nr:hypothetical protein [Rubrivivax sp. A210]CAD5372619.1 hypothetical protein RA210_U200006 [Rubrivivax sp. A210]
MSGHLFAAQAFGLAFRSNRHLAEMQPAATAAAAADDFVAIDWLEPAADASCANPPHALVAAGDGSYRLQVPAVAAYRIWPTRIEVHPAAGAGEREVRLFLLGSAVGALLQLRGLTVLHGSAVALPGGGAAVICGASTAGKSTLAAALAQRGHALLADDVTAVQLDAEGRAWCLPGLARTKLWRDALDRLGLADRVDESTRLRPDIDKHALGLATGTQPLPLRRFYELQAVEEGGLRFEPIAGMAKLTALLNHVYRPDHLPSLGLHPALLRQAAALASQLACGRIVRPRGHATLDAIVAGLQRQWAEA